MLRAAPLGTKLTRAELSSQQVFPGGPIERKNVAYLIDTLAQCNPVRKVGPVVAAVALLASLLALVTAAPAAISAPATLVPSDGVLIVGVPGEELATSSEANSGVVHVLADRGVEQVLSQDVAVFRGGSNAAGQTGTAVVSGDFDGDNFADVAIGAPGEESVRVVMGDATGGFDLATTKRFTAQGPIPGAKEAGDSFGAVLAVGDFNNDGRDDLAIGIPGEDLGGRVNAGAVVVMYGSPSGLRETGSVAFTQSGVIAGAPESGDGFGSALAAGDFNGDGFDELAIGVPGEDLGSIANAGMVHVLAGSATGVIAGKQYLTQRTSSASARFLSGAAEAGDGVGTSLAAGDFDGDGSDDLAVGAPGEDLGSISNAGLVNIARGSANGLSDIGTSISQRGIVPGAAEADDRFGSAVATGDVNGDGFDELLVGVPGEDVGSAVDAGAITLLAGTPTGLSKADSLGISQKGPLAGAAEAGDELGAAVALDDLNGDGFDDVAIGAPGENIGSIADAGLVHVIYGDSSVGGDLPGNRVFRQGNPASDIPNAGDRFGAAVFIAPGNGQRYADLSIAISDDADPVNPRTTVTYTVDVHNNGTATASGVVVDVDLPAGVTLVRTTGCAQDPSGVATCSLGSLGADGSDQFTIEVTVNAATLGTVTVDATVSSAATDLHAANNNASETTLVVALDGDLGRAPVAADDGHAVDSSVGDDFHIAVDATLTSSTAENLLGNDTLASPTATITHFGGGDAGGTVATHGAGATATTGGISLVVNADGSFVFTPATGFAGEFAFDYRITNSAGTSDATVTIAVGEGGSAANDAYGSAGNVGITVPVAQGVLANDSSGTVSAFDAASVQGGTVAVASDGSFTYNPPMGYEGTDSFGYTHTGAVGTDTATVTLTVADMYWFIDNNLTDAGNGTLATPFNTLAAFEAVNGNGGVTDPAAGEIIYVRGNSAGNYAGGLTLEDNQVLVGEASSATIVAVAGTTLPTHSNVLPTVGANMPTLTNTADAALQLASNNTVRGLGIFVTGSVNGMVGSNVGTLTVAESNASVGAGKALDLDNGVMNVTMLGLTATGATAGAVDLTNIAAGSTVNLTELAITATGGTAINISGAGAVNITGAANTVTNTGGPAVSIVGTDIGVSGVTFASISASNATNGINLSDTGEGPFTSNAGTISSITGDAVTISSTNGPITLANMTFQDIGETAGAFHTRSGHDAIHGENVQAGLFISNVTADNISDNFINGSAIADGATTTFNALTVTGSTISDTNRFHVAGVADGIDEGSIRINGLTGPLVVTNNDFDRSAEFLDILTATSGSLTMTITGNTFDDAYKEFDSGARASVGNICVDISQRGSIDLTVNLGGAGALTNTFTNCALASIRVTTDSPAVTGTTTVSIRNNDFHVTDHSSTLGASGNFPQGGVLLDHNGTGAFDALVEDNDFGRWTGTATADWVMNANGSTGALSILADGGTTEVEVANNAFNTPINAPFFVRANGSSTTTNLYFHDNIYRHQFDNFSPDPFFGSFLAPGLQHDISAQNAATLDFTAVNEAISEHDSSFDFQDTFELAARTGATVCGSFTNVTTALADQHGDLRLTNSASTFNHHDGGGNDPFETSGTIGTAAGCTLPSGPLFSPPPL